VATTLLLALVSFLQLYDTTPIKKGKEGGSWGEKVSRLLWRVLYQTPGYASRTPRNARRYTPSITIVLRRNKRRVRGRMSGHEQEVTYLHSARAR
jgi:hypothetical protein